MYRHRNRPKYTDDELKIIYAQPHDHTQWPDHILRVEKTIEVGRRLIDFDRCWVEVADLSCGNAAIAQELVKGTCCYNLLLGDFASGYTYTGPIEETIDQILHVDLFICSETIEHLDDPDLVLRKIRDKADRLLLSTPNCSWPDPNPEHYWSWDNEAVQAMLIDAGWNPRFYEESRYIQEGGSQLGYTYQIWGCE